jgi:hypothetical protein
LRPRVGGFQRLNRRDNAVSQDACVTDRALCGDDLNGGICAKRR